MQEIPNQVSTFALQHGIVFRQPVLLRTALTHRSFLNEHPELDWEDNERLEYLGDAVLDFLLADYLFRLLPDASEGDLTGLRASLVRRDTLARLAARLGLGAAVLMGVGEAGTGGRARAAVLCGAFEALVGALYLDGGVQPAAELVMPMMEEEAEGSAALGGARAPRYVKDAKSQLQELAQASLGITPRYRMVQSEGPDHAKTFTVEVLIGEAVCGSGTGSSKQAAAQGAAGSALSSRQDWCPAPFQPSASPEASS